MLRQLVHFVKVLGNYAIFNQSTELLIVLAQSGLETHQILNVPVGSLFQPSDDTTVGVRERLGFLLGKVCFGYMANYLNARFNSIDFVFPPY
jgi:hypothetical protein